MNPPSNADMVLKRWLGRSIRCFVRDVYGRSIGPHVGTVKGLSSNEVSARDEGASQWEYTGLLVEIPELGRNQTYGEWPVEFSHAKLTDGKEPK